MKDTWTCTDPDNFQYGRKIADGIYEFREFDRVSYTARNAGETYEDEKAFIDKVFDDDTFWTEATIDLTKYSDEKKESVASSYYGSLDDLKETNGESWEWILAECIFEVEESYLY